MTVVGANSSMPRVNILGVGLSAVDMDAALDHTEALIQKGLKGYICVTGVHGIMEAQGNAEIRSTLNESFLSVPDGMPTVWIGRIYGHRNMRRVYGPDFMLRLCERSAAKGYRHFLFGGNIGVAQQLRQNLVARCPGLQVVGTFTPPFRPLNEAEMKDLQHQVTSSGANLLWVGLSTPKQELFMRESLKKLNVNVMIGVGAAFDIHTGRLSDAPAWMKNSGLQWLHRLCQEPRRLARRYLVNNPLFLLKLCVQLLSDLVAGRLPA